MKTLPIMALTLFMSGCANAQSTTIMAKLEITGEPLPAIRHVTDMKVSSDTLLFVFECEDGYGQRLLCRAIIDSANNTINISSDMGKRKDGSYVSYMPYPFIADNGAIHVVGQDDCEIFAVDNDTVFVRTRQYLMDGNSTVPFPLSQYVQDIYMAGPDKYVFIGREPNGGCQYAMTADLTTSKIDTIRQINISPELQTWMPNAGEMAYSGKHNRLAFAYKLHPVIEIFDTDGKIIRQVRIGEDSFDCATLVQADFSDLNPLHFVDVATTDDYIYALHYGRTYDEVMRAAENDSAFSVVYKFDWDGRFISKHEFPMNIVRIAAYDTSRIILFDKTAFYLSSLI